MTRPAPIHPCAGVPAREQSRLAVAAFLGLADLAAGVPLASSGDALAALLVARQLLDEHHTDEAHEAVRAGLAALDDVLQSGQKNERAARAAEPGIDVFEQLLRTTTWRRLRAAQDQAAADLAVMTITHREAAHG